ncbi:family 10 glycosylhydrolase [Anabaena cylindrica UHCC 0172]|uniref:family 10 glycosylhydrolase n=1 Tax=Anabaena cylindrica TaxID=1165 RepID=UPI002B216430|nr:family 10 glycosylhydrolase [Anabaena cylindrica]MEA5551405.1 family 10 glycosylhydrolase [Anabaena cylindrica UHCC 0172]
MHNHIKIKIASLFIVNINFLVFNLLEILPTKAATEINVLGVIKSQENSNQWKGITNRLQAVGAKYCVIPLDSVKNVADLGKQQVLLLPNIEVLTPLQAIALEEWMSRGGRLIASGPIGSLSTPGVRQLLRTLLGGYWAFSLNEAQELQPAKTQPPEWANRKELFGKVVGAVMISDHPSTQVAAVWNSQDQQSAVLTTERSTLLGWRLGTDTAATADLDTAWLKAALSRYLKWPNTKIVGEAANCPPALENASTTAQSPALSNINPPKTRNQPRRVIPQKKPNLPKTRNQPRRVIAQKKPNLPKTRIRTTQVNSRQPKPQSKPVSQNFQEAIDQLETAVRLDVLPNSNQPIDSKDAVALQKELENLIGRVESANLAASVHGYDNVSKLQNLKLEREKLVSTGLETTDLSLEENLAQAREVAKNIPVLIAQKKYALARQQWLKTKTNLWQQFPINQRIAQPEIRAVWLDRGTIVKAGNEAGLVQIFDRLSQTGINTIFFETVNAGYTIYPSQVAPQQNPLIKDWDPLAVAVKLAHARGMELHAWVWTFAAGNRPHNEIINVSPDYPGPVLAANPNWANYDQRGQMIPSGQTKPFLDPANPEVRQYLLKLYEEILTQYQVDGLHLDYIRYPFQDPFVGKIYGYGKAAREQFQQLTGVDPVNIAPTQRDLWHKWTTFRTEQVDSFVAEVSQMLRQKRANLILSVAVFPLPEYERVQKIQQRWEVWARRGDIDLVVPMTYALDTPRFQRLAQPWINSTKLGSTLLVPGIRLLSLPTVGAFDQLQMLRDLPVSGYALFAADNFNNKLDEIFNNTQGKLQNSKNEPIPQRQPFRTAAFRYMALEKEWQFVREKGQLQMSASTISTFKNQSQELQNILNQLAASPSPRNLISARASLNRFQSRFRIWMIVAAKENPYQVKVWENRLLTIERLLRYGERRVINK